MIGENSSIRFCVQFAKPSDVPVVLVAIMEEIVCLREPFSVLDHERCPEIVLRLPNIPQHPATNVKR